ncbi:MAG TPA: hypothetical protein VFV10_16535 [Gammaproteobacteria bacterium]|nr:hypothetical protein [Gammaproteobacteria bacterium]
MEVRIVHDDESAACVGPDYVRVSAWCDPEQDTVTLATIERVVHKRPDDERSATRIKTLLAERPMSPDAALELACSYAERKNIPLVLSDIRLDAHR